MDFQSLLEVFVKTLQKEKHFLVTDADGTLWQQDLGELFIQWACFQEKTLKPRVWDTYQHLAVAHPLAAYVYYQKILGNLDRNSLKDLIREFISTLHLTLNPLTLRLSQLPFLEILVITASPAILVDAVLTQIWPVGTCQWRVWGMHNTPNPTSPGILLPSTWYHGKTWWVNRLLPNTPKWALGDTVWDQPLLEQAQQGYWISWSQEPTKPLPPKFPTIVIQSSQARSQKIYLDRIRWNQWLSKWSLG